MTVTGGNAFYYTVEGPPYLTIEIPELNTRIAEQVYQIEPPGDYEPIFRRSLSLGGAYKFAKGNIVLFYEIFASSGDTLETIDGTLGSYRVEIFNNGDQTATFEVYNKTGRESFTRDYLYPPLAFFSDRTRDETPPFLIFPQGWGGNLEQYIRWTEDLPESCGCSTQ